MNILFVSQDPVLISCVRDALEQEGILSFIFDGNISIMEGSIAAFNKRVMVVDDELDAASEIYLSILENYK